MHTEWPVAVSGLGLSSLGQPAKQQLGAGIWLLLLYEKGIRSCVSLCIIILAQGEAGEACGLPTLWEQLNLGCVSVTDVSYRGFLGNKGCGLDLTCCYLGPVATGLARHA